MATTSSPPPRLIPLRRDRLVERIVRVVAGQILFGVGLALLVLADLGLPPWDVLHQGLTEQFGLTIGTWINIVGALLVLVMVALREPIGLGTAANVIVIGRSLDATLWLVDEPSHLGARLALVALGPVLVAIGSGVYIGARLGPGPRDGLMTALARRGITTWKARGVIEAGAFAGGVVLGGSFGLGTAVFLVSIGPLVQLALDRFSLDDPEPTPFLSPF